MAAVAHAESYGAISPASVFTSPNTPRGTRVQVASGQSVQFLSLQQKRERAAVLDALCSARRGRAAAVARAWGVTDTRVGQARGGDMRITDALVERLPAALRAEFWARLGGPVQLSLF